MKAQERIAKLEALLARVSARAAEPRQAEAAPKAAAAPAAASPAAVNGPAAAFTSPTRPTVTARKEDEEAPEPHTEELDLDAVELVSVPPPPMPEAVAEDPTESRERMVAAPVVDEVTEAVRLPGAPRAAEDDAPELEVSAEETPELEVAGGPELESEEGPPSSSRRPISQPPERPLEELTFGDAPAPPTQHTPPPESGRQVATTPPDLDFDSEATGVRSKPDEVAAVSPERAKSAPPAAAAAPVAPAPLTPEIVRPARMAEEAVAVFVGKPAAFKPSSFGDLLDASMDL